MFDQQKEKEEEQDQMIPSYHFRNSVIAACQDLFRHRKEVRQRNMSHWICFCNFVAEIYKTIRVRGSTLRIISDILFDVIGDLVRIETLQNLNEVTFASHCHLLF